MTQPPPTPIAVERDTWRRLWHSQNSFNSARRKRSLPALSSYHLHQHEDDVLAISRAGGYASYTEGGTLHGYRVVPTKDHQDLVNMKPDELEPLRAENGRYHGQLIRVDGVYHILIGPPLVFRHEREDAEPPTPATARGVRYAFVAPPDD